MYLHYLSDTETKSITNNPVVTSTYESGRKREDNSVTMDTSWVPGNSYMSCPQLSRVKDIRNHTSNEVSPAGLASKKQPMNLWSCYSNNLCSPSFCIIPSLSFNHIPLSLLCALFLLCCVNSERQPHIVCAVKIDINLPSHLPFHPT